MKGAGSEPIGIPIVCLNIFSPNVKKQLFIRYFTASLVDFLSNRRPVFLQFETHLAPEVKNITKLSGCPLS